MGILTTLRNAWKIQDLRRKILYTLFIIVIFRIGANIPVPFIDSSVLASVFASGDNLFSYLNMLSGSALSAGTVFALTIQPYINASIIMQLLTIAIPYFERLQKDGGEEGKKKMTTITRCLTVVIGILQAYGYYVTLSNSSALTTYASKGENFLVGVTIIAILVAGSCLVMWLGESINEKGIGNGISIVLFASIVSRGQSLVMSFVDQINHGRWWMVPLILVLGIALITVIVFMDNAERRVPIQYAKKQIGRKTYGGQNTHLPIKVIMAGVMPIIFAFAIVSLPATIAAFVPNSGFATFIENHFSSKNAIYMIITFILIIAFNYFYLAIQYNTVEIANNIKNNGGTIPGIRPGKPTSDFLKKTVNRVTIAGAVFLGFIAVLPYVLGAVIPAASNFGLGGTSILIVVSVALETVKQLESQMLMRHYKGFLE